MDKQVIYFMSYQSAFRVFRRLCLLTIFFLYVLPLHAKQITVSVEAYNRAVAEGDDSEILTISYIQKQKTAYKCRLSEGDSAILRIEGLPESVIHNVTLSMRSNKTSGAGSMQLRIGGQTVWQIADASFASDHWHGSFSDTYVPVSHSLNHPSGTLELVIVSSQNSLYFNSLTIDYILSAPSPHTVTLDCGTGAMYWLTETAAGAGVLLPSPDPVNDDWRPIGWTETSISQQTECPLFYASGDYCFPARDMRLYALYRSDNGLQTLAPDTSFSSGEYAIVSGEPFNVVATGAVSGRAVPVDACELHDGYLLADHAAPYCRYQLSFDGDSVLIYHEASSSWLGHSDSGLNKMRSRWAWQPAVDGTICFSFGNGSSTMCLLPKDESLTLYRLADNDPAIYPHLLLFPIDSLPTEPQTVVYTSHPLCGVGLPNLPADSCFDAPHAEKRFIDGRIILFLPDGRCYDLMGRLLFTRQ